MGARDRQCSVDLKVRYKENEQNTRKGEARGNGVADEANARPLDVFPKVKQKNADLRWWIEDVRQIILWVGDARPGRRLHADGRS